MSTQPPASSDRAVVDTVVLRYFAFADRLDLLLDLLGRPLFVPRVVLDPDEGDPSDLAACEITRSVRFQRQAARDPARDPVGRQQAHANATALEALFARYERGEINIVDLEPEERRIMAGLTSPSGCAAFGLLLPLDPGEAACLAAAVTRRLCLATDDSDALKALQALSRPGTTIPYERIRRLLIRAAEEGLISRAEANAIHTEMTRRGFRDKVLPFPP